MSSGRVSQHRGVLRPPFLTCVAALAAATVMAGPGARYLRIVVRKEPVPLRRPLSELSKDEFGDYRFVSARTIDEAILNPLGTDMYIDWQFEDTSVRKNSDPRRHLRCFITYYTGRSDQVPHTPDNCFLGAGYKIVSAANLSTYAPGPDGQSTEVPIRAVTFRKSDVYERDKPTVVYTFHCNGRFLGRRNAVRARLAAPLDKGAYFCKIEISFGARGSVPRTPGPEDTIAAAKKFLSRLVPVLLRDHLPDWQAVQQDGADAA